MKRLLLAAAGVVFLVWTAGTALTQVQPGERAVVRRFGRFLPERPSPGLHIGLPWGIDVVTRVPIGLVRRVTIGLRETDEEATGAPAGQLQTGDHNLVNVQAEILYVVREEDIDRFVVVADRADDLVARVAETALAEWVAGHSVDEALLRGKARLPAVLVDACNRRLADYRVGIQVEQASLTRLHPPEEVRDAFERVAQAQTGIRTQVNQAEEEADRRRREAEAERFRLMRLASAYAEEQRFAAQAEAAGFLKRLAQYRQLAKDDPNAINALWRDEVTRLFARMKTGGRIDLLDHHLSGDSLNITQFPPAPKRK